jgi:hypothetical protein
MPVFHIVVEGLSSGHRLAAFVVADDETEAKALVTADHRFDGYRMPPIELSVDPERHPAANEAFRKLGIAKPEKGVFAVGEVEPES